MPDLLIELLSEEIPARMQPRAREDLRRLVTDGLVERGLTYRGARAVSTPRRLALALDGLSERSPTTREARRGPREGAPAKAVEGFARGAGVPVEALEIREEGKGRFHFAAVVTEGRPAESIVAEALEAAIRGFPWPKSMRWGEGSLRWVRPLRRILCLLSDEAGARVVPLVVDGIEAGDVTEGHRFMAPEAFRVSSYQDYARSLRRAFVMIDPEERREAIRSEARNLAFARGLEVIEDEGLLEEVAGLVEWPVVLLGEVGPFQDLPPEVLQTSMKAHQKFLSLRDREGRITHFVTVANRETADDGATILAGNRKVLAARLSDARFFWENDLRVAKAGMGEWRDKLASVTFHAKVGSQAERIERIAALAREIAPSVGADPEQAERAARLAKLDLRSAMVGEFPELQGTMGRYYAEAAGEAPEVAAAAEEHYAPEGPSGAVPTAPVSVAVALADKIDTLTDFWAIREKPTGSSDPYALRRAALGVIRLVTENDIGIEVFKLIERAYLETLGGWWNAERLLIWNSQWPDQGSQLVNFEEESLVYRANKGQLVLMGNPAERQFKGDLAALYAIELPSTQHLVSGLLSFLHDRLKVYLRDRGIRHDVIDASLAKPGAETPEDDLTLLVRRAEALQALLATEDGENLVQGFRRAANILAQAEARDGVEYSFGADPKFAETPEERALFEALAEAQAEIAPAMAEERFEDAMRAMARLRGPIDAFFEAVQVNAENEILRRNRLNLLGDIRRICLQVADLSRLEG